jgi:Tfp pilus assembly protein PilF
VFVLSVSLIASGQTDRTSHCELDVVLTSSDGRPVQARLLLIGSNLLSQSGVTDSTGRATFLSLPQDDFTLVVHFMSGKESEERVSTRNGNCAQSERITLSGSDELPNGSEVSVVDLRAPSKAKRLYQEGLSELHRQHWRKAERLLERAVTVYPNFSAAYNALGVAASENGDSEAANTAFHCAIQARANYSEAYLNFGESLIRQRRFRETEVLMNELLTFDQGNRAAVSLLVECLLEQQKFDEVIGVVQQVHAQHRAHDVFVHRCASEIYRQRGMKREFDIENATIAAESSIHR